MTFTENDFEYSIIELFRDHLGYSHRFGPDIIRDYHNPLYEDQILPALQRINPGIPAAALEEALYKIKNIGTGLPR